MSTGAGRASTFVSPGPAPAPPPPAPVTSVFGRIGAVIAAVGDYLASQVTNDSSVTGTRVSDALNTLATTIGALTSTAIANASGVAGATVTAALNALATSIAALNVVYAPFRLTVTAVGASRALLASDNNSLLVCNSGSAIVLTVNGGVNAAGDVVPIVHKGGGALSVLAGSGGMVITPRPGGGLNSAGTGAYSVLVFESSTLAYYAGQTS